MLQIVCILLGLAAVGRGAGVAAQHIAVAFPGELLHHMGGVGLMIFLPAAAGAAFLTAGLCCLIGFLHGNHPFTGSGLRRSKPGMLRLRFA